MDAKHLDQLANDQLGRMWKRTVSKPLEMVPRELTEGEAIELMLAAVLDGDRGLLLLTDRRLLFVGSAGLMGRRQVSQDFRLAEIRSVEFKQGHASGQFTVLGSGIETEFNAVQPKDALPEFVRAVRARAGSGTAAPAASSVKSPSERLADAKAMLDAGAISQAEYDEIRQRILSEM